MIIVLMKQYGESPIISPTAVENRAKRRWRSALNIADSSQEEKKTSTTTKKMNIKVLNSIPTIFMFSLSIRSRSNSSNVVVALTLSSKRMSSNRNNIKPNRPPTEFEEKVYEKCKQIPSGKVVSYGVLAASLEGKGSARSVGGAMKRNPYAPFVP